jgi:putative endonuclease
VILGHLPVERDDARDIRSRPSSTPFPTPHLRYPAPVSDSASDSTYVVYILRCADGTLYTGCTNDVEARERAHNEGRGAKYTAGRRPVKVVYSEVCASRSEAQKREFQLKRLSREQKESLL